MSTTRSTRRVAAALLGGSAVLLATAGPATADPMPPNCTSADLAGIMAGVSAAMSAYLFTHPDVNAFFTDLQGTPKEDVRAATQAYLDANPDVRTDLDNIRQPSTDFRIRCDIGHRALAEGVV